MPERGPTVETLKETLFDMVVRKGNYIDGDAVAHAIAALYQGVLDENARLKSGYLDLVDVGHRHYDKIATLRADLASKDSWFRSPARLQKDLADVQANLARKDAALRECRDVLIDLPNKPNSRWLVRRLDSIRSADAALAPAPPTQARAEGEGT